MEDLELLILFQKDINVVILHKFILKNDINDEEFECIPVGDFNTKAEYLTNKDQYIGRLAVCRV